MLIIEYFLPCASPPPFNLFPVSARGIIRVSLPLMSDMLRACAGEGGVGDAQ